jgi:hypothetical protein
LYSTVSLFLESCSHNEDEQLPIAFDCCFFLTDSSIITHQQQQQPVVGSAAAAPPPPPPVINKSIIQRTFITTDNFLMTGHVSKPMILFKTSELFSHVNRNNQINNNSNFNIHFTIKPFKDSFMSIQKTQIQQSQSN